VERDEEVSESDSRASGGTSKLPRGKALGLRLGAQVISSLAVADFRILLLGSIGSFLASQMLFVARSYLAYTLANSAIAVGAVSFAWGLPMVGLSLFGGAIADRIDKRRLLIAVQAIMGVAALLLAMLVATNRIQVWHLVASALVEGAALSFNFPARQAIIPQLVGKSKVGNAIALNAVANNLSRVAGPALAGTLIGATCFGMAGTLFLTVGVYCLVVLTVRRLPPVPSDLIGARESILTSVGVGMRFLWRNPLLLMLMGMAFIPVMFGLSYQALLPVFSSEILALGPEGLGNLYAAAGCGAVLGSLLVASFGALDNRSNLLRALGALFGAALSAFALSRDYWSASALLLLLGIVGQTYLTVNNALIMTSTPPKFHGRMMSIYMLTFSLQPLAALPLGALADAIGVSPTLVISGLVIVAFVACLAILNPPTSRPAPAAP